MSSHPELPSRFSRSTLAGNANQDQILNTSDTRNESHNPFQTLAQQTIHSSSIHSTEKGRQAPQNVHVRFPDQSLPVFQKTMQNFPSGSPFKAQTQRRATQQSPSATTAHWRNEKDAKASAHALPTLPTSQDLRTNKPVIGVPCKTLNLAPLNKALVKNVYREVISHLHKYV